jgi:hypothetical protein
MTSSGTAVLQSTPFYENKHTLLVMKQTKLAIRDLLADWFTAAARVAATNC